MSTTKHTPGPWQVNHEDRTQVCDASGELGCAPIAWISRRNPRGRTEDYANARLIAAAPELLEAVQAAWNCIGELPPTQARVEVAQLLQAAIKKAIGEQP